MAVKGNRETSGGSRHSDWKQWKHLEGRRGRQGRQGKSVAGKILAAFADGEGQGDPPVFETIKSGNEDEGNSVGRESQNAETMNPPVDGQGNAVSESGSTSNPRMVVY